MSHPRSFATVLFACALLFAVTSQTADSQTAPPSDTKLPLKAVLVLTPEFCATKPSKGSWATIKEKFEVGKVACTELEPALKEVFSSLTVMTALPAGEAKDAQVVLIPRFVDVAANTTIGAFSNREMDVFLEWTIKDMSGKTVWLETVEGSSKHHMGNMFTHSKNVKLIATDSVKNAASESAKKMSSAPELRKLGP
jgi:hypothetical protein